MYEMTERELTAFNAIPKPPDGSKFTLEEVRTRFDPHPYVIGSRHVAWAADHHGGMLGQAAIESAEKNGITCAHKGCTLRHDEHKSELVAMIRVPVHIKSSLKEVEGLHEYLLSIKEVAEKAGIEGFGFPY